MIARITMEPTRLLALALLCVAPRSLPAQSPRRASRAVAPSGFAPARLARIDRFMQQYVDSGEIGGAVGLVLKDGRVVYQHAVGWLDKESGRRMTTDALFRIASQTKAVTTVAVLSLIEEGSLAAGDPVSRYIPAFAHTTVGTKSDTGLVTKPAARPITGRHLVRYRRAGRAAVCRERTGDRGGMGLVHGRQGRTDLHHDGAARDAAVRRAAG